MMPAVERSSQRGGFPDNPENVRQIWTGSGRHGRLRQIRLSEIEPIDGLDKYMRYQRSSELLVADIIFELSNIESQGHALFTLHTLFCFG